MGRKEILLLLSLLIALSANCQIGSTKYPKKILFQGDSLVGFTYPQVVKIRLLKIDLEQAGEMIDSLEVQLDKQNYLLENYVELSNRYRSERETALRLADKNDLIIARLSSINSDLREDFEKERTLKNIFGGGLIASLLAILGFAIFN